MKVIIHKDTGQYAHYFGSGDFALSNLPRIYPETMNEDAFIKYVLEQEGCELNLDDYEIKDISIEII